MPKKYNLFLKGEVGGWWSTFNSDMVNYVLDKYKDSTVHVLINSLGGYVHEAMAISALFKTHGDVHVHFVGMNASAATIAAMGAKHISIDADALFLVHKCLNPVFEWDVMNADQLDEHIKKLNKQKDEQINIDACIAGTYARRCKKSKDELLALMSKDTWLSAEQAKEWGFVDEITNEAEDKQPEPTASVAASMASAGIPLPPGYDKKDSFMDRFLAFFKQFSFNQAPECSEAAAKDAEGAKTHSPLMAKFTALCTLLGVTISLADDKTLHLSEEQADKVNRELDTLNASVANKDKTIADLQAKLDEANKTIADLKKEPAASTGDVVDSKKDEADPYAPVSQEDAMAASKAFLEFFK